jgi:hypothetical protein
MFVSDIPRSLVTRTPLSITGVFLSNDVLDRENAFQQPLLFFCFFFFFLTLEPRVE